MVRAVGVADVQPDDLPGLDVGADRDRARVGVGAEQAAHEEVAALELGLAGVDDDAEQQPLGDLVALALGQRRDRLAQRRRARGARRARGSCAPRRP